MHIYYNFYLDTNLAHHIPKRFRALAHFTRPFIRSAELIDKLLVLILCALFVSAFSLGRCRRRRLQCGNLTVKCVVHLYDMLHLFGKAKHIFVSLHTLSPDLPTSILSVYFAEQFFFLLLLRSIRIHFYSFCRSDFAIFLRLCSSSAHSSVHCIFIHFLFRAMAICCLCHRRQHFILPH